MRLLYYVAVIALIALAVNVISIILKAGSIFEAEFLKVANTMNTTVDPPLTIREARALAGTLLSAVLVAMAFILLFVYAYNVLQKAENV